MKATMSKDGEKRIDFTVKYRMGAEDMAYMIVAKEMPDKEDVTPEAWADKTMKLSNRALLNVVKDEVYRDGVELPYYRVGDSGRGDFVAALAPKLKERMFK